MIARTEKVAEQCGEPELARLSVFQRRFLRLQFLVCQRQLRWSANPVTLNVRRIKNSVTEETRATLEDALIHEVWRQDVVAVRRLLAAGANPNLPGRAWSSAIACAGENDETGEIVRILVDAGADVNIQDEFGLTPLHRAVDMAIDGTIQQNLKEIDWTVVGVYLELGADPNIRDKNGETIADVASAYGYNAKQSFDDFMRTRSVD